jgi:hypothetical protein
LLKKPGIYFFDLFCDKIENVHLNSSEWAWIHRITTHDYICCLTSNVIVTWHQSDFVVNVIEYKYKHIYSEYLHCEVCYRLFVHPRIISILTGHLR